MKKIVLFLFILICQLPSLVMAGESVDKLENESLDHYYKNLFMGEMKTGNYSGPLNPRAKFNEETGELLLLDDQFNANYLNDQIQGNAFDLHEFWFKKVVEKSACPDVTLGESIDYIRYLYRLLSISYLFESIKINHNLAAELGAGKNICSISYQNLFEKCRPVSSDMKKFHERVYGKFANDISKIKVSSFNKSEISNWLNNFHHSTALSLDPASTHLHEWCYDQKKNCRDLSVEEVKLALRNICDEESDLIQNICSEKDNLYGASYVEKAAELIQTSNAFKLINNNGTGEDCLRRYSKIFIPKEIHYGFLGHQFPLIYSELVRKNSRYLQGDLFLPGALKEFDMKGLSDFLAALKPPVIEPVIKALPIPKPKPKPKPAPVVVEVKHVEVPIPTPAVVEVVPPPEPKISVFEKAVIELESKKLDSLNLNMVIFRDDFEFTSQMVAALAAPIKKFQTRAALTDMKSYDNLGSFESPVGLIFLKYLLDTENHQGLYNIINILGEKFYVNNDIEKMNHPVFIELRNNQSTNNHWQIVLLKDPGQLPKK